MGDKDERNDLSFLFVLEGETNRTSGIRLFSVGIRAFEVRLANEQEWQFLKRTMQAKCKAFGTTMEAVGQGGITDHAAPSFRDHARKLGTLLASDRYRCARARSDQGRRHLVLPGGIAESGEIMRFLAEDISRNTYVNIMDQYRPCWKAFNYPLLNRQITREEFEEAVEVAKAAGLHRLHHERPGSAVARIAEV